MNEDGLRRRALRNLRRAVEEAGPELPYAWYAHGDPDFDELRVTPAKEPARDWEDLMARLAPRRGTARPVVSQRIRAETAEAERELRSRSARPDTAPKRPEVREVTVPDSPLGDPRLRLPGWILVAAGLAVLVFLLALGLGLGWILAAVVAALIAGRSAHRAYVAGEEIWTLRQARRPTRRPAAPTDVSRRPPQEGS